MRKLGIFISLCATLWLAGCCSSETDKEPKLAYLVAYSVLDSRFHTSTRLDLTADILNGTSEDLEMVQLVLTDREGKDYTLDYQTIESFAQVGRFNAIPLDAPIAEMLLGGEKGVEHHSPSGLHFLFMTGFESGKIKYRNSSGMHELPIKDLAEVIQRSREETIEWMRKEHEEREKMLEDLKVKADKKMKERRAKQG